MINLEKMQKYLDVLFRDVTALGSFMFYLLFLLLTLTSGEIGLFWQLCYGFLFTLITVMFIRLFYFKERPQKQQFSNFVEKIDAASFPSLHTARAVMLALFLMEFFQNNLVTIFLTSTSFLVMYSRVYLHKHDWVDVAGGVLLGVVTFLLALVL